MSTTIDEAISHMLSARERRYLGGMKRARRRALTDVLRRHSATDCVDSEVPLRLQVLGSGLPEDVRYDIFRRLDHNDSDKFISWVHKALALPLRVYSTPDYLAKPRDDAVLTAALQRAQRVMDTTMEGQSALKQEVLQIICSTAQSMAGARNYALGLEGPPGCGKTHFAKHGMARALQRPFVSIPLGGATDASNLLGTAYFYEGSKEGRLAAALIEARCCNPVVHFDEVDKIPKTERGAEVEATLIHIIDPSASGIRDRYLHGIDLDFSQCTFVFSYNDPERVSPILLDRIKRVRVTPPTDVERAAIVTQHILPRVNAKLGTTFTLTPSAVTALTAPSGGEGLRNTERDVDHVLSTASLARRLGGDLPPPPASEEIDATFVRDVLAKRDQSADRYTASTAVGYMYT